MPRRRGRGRPKGSKNKVYGGISNVSAGILGSLSSYRQQILSEIAGLQRQANALTEAMEAMGAAGPALRAASPMGMGRVGRPPGRPPGRPVGSGAGPMALESGRLRAKKGSLKECIVKVLAQSSGPVPVKEIIPGVKRVGYQTNSKSLGNQISMALRGMKQVRRVGHGLYALAS